MDVLLYVVYYLSLNFRKLSSPNSNNSCINTIK